MEWEEVSTTLCHNQIVVHADPQLSTVQCILYSVHTGVMYINVQCTGYSVNRGLMNIHGVIRGDHTGQSHSAAVCIHGGGH